MDDSVWHSLTLLILRRIEHSEPLEILGAVDIIFGYMLRCQSELFTVSWLHALSYFIFYFMCTTVSIDLLKEVGHWAWEEEKREGFVWSKTRSGVSVTSEGQSGAVCPVWNSVNSVGQSAQCGAVLPVWSSVTSVGQSAQWEVWDL